MKKIEEIVTEIDFTALRQQKLDVLNHIRFLNGSLSAEYIQTIGSLGGIIHMIDAIQDAVVEDGIKTEAEVFGEEINGEAADSLP